MRALERKSNSIMAELLVQRPPQRSRLNQRLSRYITDGVVKRNGFVLLQTEKDCAGTYNLHTHFDETGYECLVSHIHIDPKETDDTSQLDLGLAYADRLAEVLQGCGYRGPFRIILTYGLDDGVCTVRFHRVRDGQTWLDDDLQSYKR